MPAFIGNDVVDLRSDEAMGKAADQRFVRRVCAPAEQALLADLPTAAATTLLWQLWSAKEAAFKAAHKAYGARFSPAAFAVDPAIIPGDPIPGDPIPGDNDANARGANKPEPVRWGRVCWRDQDFMVSWRTTHDYVHCLARSTRHPFPTRAAIKHMADFPVAPSDSPPEDTDEAATARSPQSKAVRALARQLLHGFGIGDIGIDGADTTFIREVKGVSIGPPRVYQDGRWASEWDVSFSHHGRFVAAAVLQKPVLEANWDNR